MRFPEPVVSVRLDPETARPTRTSSARPSKLPARIRPSGAGRPETGPDGRTGHGRAPPRDHRRPPAPRVRIEAHVGRPQVAYRETITGPPGEGDFDRQARRHGPVRRARARGRATSAGAVVRHRDRTPMRRRFRRLYPRGRSWNTRRARTAASWRATRDRCRGHPRGRPSPRVDSIRKSV